MGCGGSAMPMPPMESMENVEKMKLDIPSAIAFSVPLSEDEDSVVKKHPPKRLRMMEGQQSPPLTHEMLLEKLADADQRRQQILSQRIESAKTMMRPRYNSVNKAVSEGAVEEQADGAEEEEL